MEYSIKFDKKEDLLVIKTEGTMNSLDYISMAQDILRYPDHRSGGNSVFDHRDLDFSHVRLEDLERIRAFHVKNEERIGSGKSAFLFGKGRAEAWIKLWSMGEKIKTSNRVRIFEDDVKMLEWLKEK